MQKLKTRKLNRFKNYNYSTNGYYFVTICSNDRQDIFGNFTNNVGAPLACARIELSKIGQIINNQWNDIPNQYDNVEIIEYVIMPNHIHGIIKLGATARVAPTGLGKIIGTFKSKCSTKYLRYIKNNDIGTSADIWQRNYYDHVIRTDSSLKQICEYIRTNLFTWSTDTKNPENNKST
ncbi:MAG: transposase [Candidatus Omnitrophica bacterium]|nr:transposase [Candidatus Omnitrophota bacterium]